MNIDKLLACHSLLLALTFCGCAEDPTAPGLPDEPRDECTAISACGDRQYCGDGVSQICILSAEGVNRCGELPSSCGVQQCETSADCAALGADYFCDTAGSGCCDDGQAEQHQRCVRAVSFAPDGGVVKVE